MVLTPLTQAESNDDCAKLFLGYPKTADKMTNEAAIILMTTFTFSADYYWNLFIIAYFNFYIIKKTILTFIIMTLNNLTLHGLFKVATRVLALPTMKSAILQNFDVMEKESEAGFGSSNTAGFSSEI